MRSARDLGIYIDFDLSMRMQVKHTVSTAMLQMLVFALVHMVLDYGNGVLVGLLAYVIRQLQSVLNAAALLSVCCLNSRDHITDALTSLHWCQKQSHVASESTTSLLTKHANKSFTGFNKSGTKNGIMGLST